MRWIGGFVQSLPTWRRMGGLKLRRTDRDSSRGLGDGTCMVDDAGRPVIPLPRERYWPRRFGPPSPGIEGLLAADIDSHPFQAQRTAMIALTAQARALGELQPTPLESALDDLRRNGIVIRGVKLRGRVRTYRLSRLGLLVRALLSNRASELPSLAWKGDIDVNEVLDQSD